MAESTADLSGLLQGLETVLHVRTALARSMGVAGGTLIRDDARSRVRVRTGKLQSAIYLAFRDARSTAERIEYSVTWNSKKAPHGHLEEFGHWRYNKVVNGHPQRSLLGGKKRGTGPHDHGGPGALATPVFEPAHPFLRPALEANRQRVMQVMLDRGRQRLPELLAGGASDEP